MGKEVQNSIFCPENWIFANSAASIKGFWFASKRAVWLRNGFVIGLLITAVGNDSHLRCPKSFARFSLRRISTAASPPPRLTPPPAALGSVVRTLTCGSRRGTAIPKESTPFGVLSFGAGDRTRTGTVLRPRDFKSLVSTIPPHRRGEIILSRREMHRQGTSLSVFLTPAEFRSVPNPGCAF